MPHGREDDDDDVASTCLTINVPMQLHGDDELPMLLHVQQMPFQKVLQTDQLPQIAIENVVTQLRGPPGSKQERPMGSEQLMMLDQPPKRWTVVLFQELAVVVVVAELAAELVATLLTVKELQQVEFVVANVSVQLQDYFGDVAINAASTQPRQQ
jgi:hypothetical protein